MECIGHKRVWLGAMEESTSCTLNNAMDTGCTTLADIRHEQDAWTKENSETCHDHCIGV